MIITEVGPYTITVSEPNPIRVFVLEPDPTNKDHMCAPFQIGIQDRSHNWFITGLLNIFSFGDPSYPLEEAVERARRWCVEQINKKVSFAERVDRLRLREAAIKELEQSGQLSLPEK